jgi:hypothetical protein
MAPMSDPSDEQSRDLRRIMQRAEEMGIDPVRVGSALGYASPLAGHQRAEPEVRSRSIFGLRFLTRRSRQSA